MAGSISSLPYAMLKTLAAISGHPGSASHELSRGSSEPGASGQQSHQCAFLVKGHLRWHLRSERRVLDLLFASLLIRSYSCSSPPDDSRWRDAATAPG